MKYKEEDMLELTYENVLNIYDSCLAKKTTPPDDRSISNFLSEEILESLNKQNHSAPTDSSDEQSQDDEENFIIFSKKQITKHQSAIHYLLGQLKAVHAKKPNLVFKIGSIRYDGTPWSKGSFAPLMALYALGYSAGFIQQFRLSKNPETPGVIYTPLKTLGSLEMTYSPSDTQNFPNWKRMHVRTDKEPADF